MEERKLYSESGSVGLADVTGGFFDSTSGFEDYAGGLDDVVFTAAALASAAKPLALSLSLNVAATEQLVSWRASRSRPVEPRHYLLGPRWS